MLRRNECRLNFKNRPVRTGDLKGGGPKQPTPPPLPLIGVARSLPLIGLSLTHVTHANSWKPGVSIFQLQTADNFLYSVVIYPEALWWQRFFTQFGDFSR